MKIGVVGNQRGWSYNYIRDKLNKSVTKGDIILSGGADGVDTYAQIYAKKNGLEMRIYYPDNDKPIPARYFERNYDIAFNCDILVAFDKGSSSRSGTLNTINSAKRLGKEIILYEDMIE